LIAFAHLWMLAAALCLDALVGDPDFIWRRLPHPVAALGGMIAAFDRVLNRERFSARVRRMFGGITIFILVLLAAEVGWGLEFLFGRIPYGWIGTIVVAAILLASRSLYDHVAAVAKAFADGGLVAGRKAVARIVGRDPASLDEAGVSRAAIESAAENFSDGVVAPALWFAVLGLPGILAYKVINTGDSMIGHLTPRHQDFGWAAARLDDLVNWPAGRLAGGLIALAAPLARGSIGKSFAVMRADAPRHRSPNAGWPEAAMAAALGVSLAGPRRYRGVLVDDPFLNAAGRRRATPDDIRRGLRVYIGAAALLFLIVAALGGAVLVVEYWDWLVLLIRE
jgi:adenosylcobinamide-phosphate synthase